MFFKILTLKCNITYKILIYANRLGDTVNFEIIFYFFFCSNVNIIYIYKYINKIYKNKERQNCKLFLKILNN